MLTERHKPLLVAAALRAMALSRDASFQEKAVDVKGDSPNIHPGKKTSGGGGYSHGSFASARGEMYERRFGMGRYGGPMDY